MFNKRVVGRFLLGTLCAAVLPMSVHAGFGFGFDSDNGFYDYDPKDYPGWGSYPPSGYRDYGPAWRRGSERDSLGWRQAPKRPGSGWRWGDAGKDSHVKKHDRDTGSWWHSRRLKGDDGWSSWGREWSFGRGDGEPTRFNFGSFDFGDRWSPSFGRKSWSFGHKPRWYPGWGHPPAAPYPGWGSSPYAAPQRRANPYGPVAPYPPQAGPAVPPVGAAGRAAPRAGGEPAVSNPSSRRAEAQSATAGGGGSSAQAPQGSPKGADTESR